MVAVATHGHMHHRRLASAPTRDRGGPLRRLRTASRAPAASTFAQQRTFAYLGREYPLKKGDSIIVCVVRNPAVALRREAVRTQFEANRAT